MSSHYLDKLFSPRSIAVFGASQTADSVGTQVFTNLLSSQFTGSVYAVNPKYTSVQGSPCYPDINAIDKPIELAVIATPAATAPLILRQCGEKGVKAAIIISAGFSEGAAQGASLEQEVVEIAHHYHIHILGPNCLGLIRPVIGMNATFSKNTAVPGQLALISQSGALCTAIMDWAAANEIGFSAIISLGNAADVDFGDLLDYLAQDHKTQSILLYVEGIRDARSFMSGLRTASRIKPVVVIKAGRHHAASKAALTHTGAMIGSDDVFNAALKRAGVVRANTIQQLFTAAETLSSQCRVHGNRLAIVTNGGGLGVMATDRAVDLGIEMASLTAASIEQLDVHLPAHWSKDNPIDILGDASPQRYRLAVETCLADPNVDGVLVMLSPQAMTDPDASAHSVIEALKGSKKPVLACWMGQRLINRADKLFTRHHVPCFADPESSVEAFAVLARFHANQQFLMQVSGPLVAQDSPDIEGARLIIEAVLDEGRQVLTTAECRGLLRAFHIPVNIGINCNSANEALVAAASLGYPVVMKINSPDIAHKTDVGGVRLNINSAQAVRNLYTEMIDTVRAKSGKEITAVSIEPMYQSNSGRELMISTHRDPVFGTAIAFGAGGVKVQVLQDRATALPPLNHFLAEQLIRQTKISKMLDDFSDMPAINRQALTNVLIRISEMVCELPEIQALDINPLMADEKGVMAIDSRIVVASQPEGVNRYDHMAIHPYPAHLIRYEKLSNGQDIVIRPIRPEDAEIEQAFFNSMSEQSRYFRFMQTLNQLTADMLIRFTQLDYSRELALIAVVEHAEGEVQVGVARYTMNPDGQSCEFALAVADHWQQRGIGSRLMVALLSSAHQQGFKQMSGEIMSTNHGMLKLVEKLGFTITTSADDPMTSLAKKIL